MTSNIIELELYHTLGILDPYAFIKNIDLVSLSLS